MVVRGCAHPSQRSSLMPGASIGDAKVSTRPALLSRAWQKPRRRKSCTLDEAGASHAGIVANRCKFWTFSNPFCARRARPAVGTSTTTRPL